MPAENWVLEADGYFRTDGATPYNVRNNLVYGTYRPDAASTGPIGTLSAHVGNLTTSINGQLIENLDITGRLTISHNSVIVRNCIIRGGTPSGASFGMIKAFDPVSPKTLIYDCLLEASAVQVESTNGIQGRDFEIHRSEIRQTVDGVGAQYGEVGVYGCWIHDLPWYEDDPNQVDGSHNDGVQIHGGGGPFTVQGCSIEMGLNTNAGIMITTDLGTSDEITIIDNWIISTGLDYCACGINVGVGANTNVTITGNKFSDRNTWESNSAALIKATTYDVATIASNTYISTGLAANVTRVT